MAIVVKRNQLVGIMNVEDDARAEHQQPDPEYPREAIRKGVERGRVVARLNIDEKGNVMDVKIVESSPPRVFDREVINAVMQWKFPAEGEKFIGEVEVIFTLKDQ